MVDSTPALVQSARPATAADKLRAAYESLQLSPDVTPDGDLLVVDNGIAIINEQFGVDLVRLSAPFLALDGVSTTALLDEVNSFNRRSALVTAYVRADDEQRDWVVFQSFFDFAPDIDVDAEALLARFGRFRNAVQDAVQLCPVQA